MIKYIYIFQFKRLLSFTFSHFKVLLSKKKLVSGYFKEYLCFEDPPTPRKSNCPSLRNDCVLKYSGLQ